MSFKTIALSAVKLFSFGICMGVAVYLASDPSIFSQKSNSTTNTNNLKQASLEKALEENNEKSKLSNEGGQRKHIKKSSKELNFKTNSDEVNNPKLENAYKQLSELQELVKSIKENSKTTPSTLNPSPAKKNKKPKKQTTPKQKDPLD